MKNLKKFLALFLALVMCLSLVNLSAFAVEGEEPTPAPEPTASVEQAPDTGESPDPGESQTPSENPDPTESPATSENPDQNPTTSEEPTTSVDDVEDENATGGSDDGINAIVEDGGESAPPVDPTFVAVESVTLNYTQHTVSFENKFNLYATVMPENATDKSLTWSTSDGSIATVSNTGYVTAYKKEGTVTITATAKNGVSASCVVTVKDPNYLVTPKYSYHVWSYDPYTKEPIRDYSITSILGSPKYENAIYGNDEYTVLPIQQAYPKCESFEEQDGKLYLKDTDGTLRWEWIGYYIWMSSNYCKDSNKLPQHFVTTSPSSPSDNAMSSCDKYGELTFAIPRNALDTSWSTKGKKYFTVYFVFDDLKMKNLDTSEMNESKVTYNVLESLPQWAKDQYIKDDTEISFYVSTASYASDVFKTVHNETEAAKRKLKEFQVGEDGNLVFAYGEAPEYLDGYIFNPRKLLVPGMDYPYFCVRLKNGNEETYIRTEGNCWMLNAEDTQSPSSVQMPAGGITLYAEYDMDESRSYTIDPVTCNNVNVSIYHSLDDASRPYDDEFEKAFKAAVDAGKLSLSTLSTNESKTFSITFDEEDSTVRYKTGVMENVFSAESSNIRFIIPKPATEETTEEVGNPVLHYTTEDGIIMTWVCTGFSYQSNGKDYTRDFSTQRTISVKGGVSNGRAGHLGFRYIWSLQGVEVGYKLVSPVSGVGANYFDYAESIGEGGFADRVYGQQIIPNGIPYVVINPVSDNDGKQIICQTNQGQYGGKSEFFRLSGWYFENDGETVYPIGSTIPGEAIQAAAKDGKAQLRSAWTKIEAIEIDAETAAQLNTALVASQVQLQQHLAGDEKWTDKAVTLNGGESIFYRSQFKLASRFSSLAGGPVYTQSNVDTPDAFVYDFTITLDEDLAFVKGADGKYTFKFTCPYLIPTTLTINGTPIKAEWTRSIQSVAHLEYVIALDELPAVQEGKGITVTVHAGWDSPANGAHVERAFDSAWLELPEAVLKSDSAKKHVKSGLALTGTADFSKINAWSSTNLRYYMIRRMELGMPNGSADWKAAFNTNGEVTVDDQIHSLQYIEKTTRLNASYSASAVAKPSFMVTFDPNGGTLAEGTVSQTVEYNKTATKPADPTRSGYTFNRWNLGDAEYDFTKPVESDITLVAQWMQNYVPPYTPPTTDIPDENPPLIDVGDKLNKTDHFSYVVGNEKGLVRPDRHITRAEAASIFFRLMTDEFRAEHWTTESPFPDVPNGTWYTTAVATAAKAGILVGTPEGNFEPNKEVTRAQFAALAANFISDSVTDPGTGDFDDTVDHWAAKQIRLAVLAGWIHGVGDKKFDPDRPITLGEVTRLVNTALERYPDPDHMNTDPEQDEVAMVTWPDLDESHMFYADILEASNGHLYDRQEDGVTEQWTKILKPIDWVNWTPDKVGK